MQGADRQWSPSVDLIETPNEVHVDVDLPGVETGGVEVSLVGSILTIQVAKKPSVLPEGGVIHLSERTHGAAQRSIPMPAPVLPESVTAELNNGVLRVRLLKSEKARAVKIPVRSEPHPGS